MVPFDRHRLGPQLTETQAPAGVSAPFGAQRVALKIIATGAVTLRRPLTHDDPPRINEEFFVCPGPVEATDLITNTLGVQFLRGTRRDQNGLVEDFQGYEPGWSYIEFSLGTFGSRATVTGALINQVNGEVDIEAAVRLGWLASAE